MNIHFELYLYNICWVFLSVPYSSTKIHFLQDNSKLYPRICSKSSMQKMDVCMWGVGKRETALVCQACERWNTQVGHLFLKHEKLARTFSNSPFLSWKFFLSSFLRVFFLHLAVFYNVAIDFFCFFIVHKTFYIWTNFHSAL